MQNRKMQRKFKFDICTAFTLIELLVVIVVIAVLAAIIIPKFTDQSARSKQAASDANIQTIQKAVAAFNADTGLMPLTINNLTMPTAPVNGADPVSGTSKPLNPAAWHGPYMQMPLPVDPVSGNPYYCSLFPGSVGQVTTIGTAEAGVAEGGFTGGGNAGPGTQD